MPLTLCVSGQKVSFCRLLSIQRPATNEGGLRVSHSRGCKCSLQWKPAGSLLARAAATALSARKAPRRTALALHPTGLGMGRIEGMGQDRTTTN